MATYARRNKVKEKVLNGELVLGMENWLQAPRIIELMGAAGFDYVHIDCEHVGRTWAEVQENVRTAELAGLTPLYRTGQCFDGQAPINEIIMALKVGVQIIKVPQVDTAETARKIVAAAKYPPLGRRGIATCDRGMREIFPTAETPLDIPLYTKEKNDEVMIWAILETPEAVKNAEEILDVEGIDCIGFGPQDYSMSAGVYDPAKVEEVRFKLFETAKRHGKNMWFNPSSAKIAKDYFDKGVRIIQFGCDIVHLNIMLQGFSNDLRKIEAGTYSASKQDDDNVIGWG